jgi:hypothetical protein
MNYKIVIVVCILLFIICIVYILLENINYKKYWIPIVTVICNNQKDKDEYDLYTKWSEYRIGDIVTKYTYDDSRQYHIDNFPDTIATEYIRRNTSSFIIKNYSSLYEIINTRTSSISPPSPTTYVIHIRVGDVIDNRSNSVIELLSTRENIWDNYLNFLFLRYTKPLSFYKNKIEMIKPLGITTIVLVAGSHIKSCYKKSTLFINCIKSYIEQESGLTVSLKLGQNPDEDIMYMSKARFFTPSGGGFSLLIKKLVLLNNGTII